MDRPPFPGDAPGVRVSAPGSASPTEDVGPRVARSRAVRVRLRRRVRALGRWVAHHPPARATALGYALYCLIGWALLCLPFAHRAGDATALDHLFTAVSAVSTTGLTTVSASGAYTPFGQGIVLVLIQLGGLGYMTLGSFVMLRRTARLPAARAGVAATVFALPEGHSVPSLVRAAVGFTLAFELVGVALLYPVFVGAGVPDPLWSAVFHAVSAFCTAGFSLWDDSLTGFRDHLGVSAVVGALSYLGAFGFIVCLDLWRVVRRARRQVTLTTKVILSSTALLTLGGTLALFVGEPTLAEAPVGDRLLAAWFQTMSALTTVGFNSVPVGALSKATLLVLTVLMVVGASPSGTGGGLKCTTFSALFGVMRSALRGEQVVRFWGHVVPDRRVWTAAATLSYYLASLVVGLYLLERCEPGRHAEQLLFEVASALGTVGLSTGITADLSAPGKAVLVALMFCGRLGPLVLGVALFPRAANGAGADAAGADLGPADLVT